MTKEVNLDGWIPAIIGASCLIGGSIIGYYVIPQVLKVLNPPKTENPNPNPPLIEEEQTEHRFSLPQPHFTRDIPTRLTDQLTARFSHSSTSVDAQSLRQEQRNQEALERMDQHRTQMVQQYRPETPNLNVPKDRRLSYGSDGHGNVMSLKSPQRKWRIKK